MSSVVAAGFLSLAAAVCLPLLSVRVAAAAATVGCALLAAAGIAAAGGWASTHVGLGSWLGLGASGLAVDRLAGIFLALAGVTGAAVSLSALERPPSRLVAALHALLLLALCTVVAADQAFLFLLAWETITLALYLIVSADRARPGGLLAAYFATGVNKLGGAALLAAFALLYARTGSFRLADWAHASSTLGGGTRAAVFALLLLGFGSKIGLVPFQGPLPPAYAAAPGIASATFSIAFNAGFYGLWRLIFGTLAPAELWWGELVIALGGIGALVGILYAVAQDEIKRFLGFSSVENGGIALIGFGVGLIGQATGETKLAAAGLLAATLHVLMHGVAKTAAFLGADRVIEASGSAELRSLGGLGPRLPRSAWGFGLAVLTLAAMPPFGGFVSEWLTLEALLQAFRVQSTAARLIMALGGALLALTAGLGLLAFAKLYGGIFLGRARSRLAAVTEPRGPALGFLGLSLCLLGLGIVAPWEIRWLGRGLDELLGFDAATTTVSHPLVLGPVYEKFSVLSPTWLAVALPAFALVTVALVRVALRPPARTASAWVSGTAIAPERVQYTPEAYTNPIRVVLAAAYGFRRRLVPAAAGRSSPPALVLETRVVPPFEHYLYRPIVSAALRLSTRARRLQSGKLSFYLLYVLLVLLAVLALIPALRH